LYVEAVEGVYDEDGSREVENPCQHRQRDGDLADVVQQTFNLLAIGHQQRPVVQRDPKAKAFEDGAVQPEPFPA